MRKWPLWLILGIAAVTLSGAENPVVKKGEDYLLTRQGKDGSWGRHPAITGLVCMALHGKHPEAIGRGRAYLLKHVRKDGSIWLANRRREYPTYTTAIALAALATLNCKEDETVMRNARKWLLNLQNSDPESRNCGGFGYGPDPRGAAHVDLSNTQWVAEALYLTDHLDREPEAKSSADTQKADLAWKRLEQFLTKVQHLPETNRETWVVSDPDDPNHGGFIYKLEEDTPHDMKTGVPRTLRSYGSMTYAGLKSMIYAKVGRNDPRVKAAAEWAARHYTVAENPGVGPNGLYYYLQTFAKAHAALGSDTVRTPDGKQHDWRADLLKQLSGTQLPDGSWINRKSGRWMESMPELVTAYALLALKVAGY